MISLHCLEFYIFRLWIIFTLFFLVLYLEENNEKIVLYNFQSWHYIDILVILRKVLILKLSVLKDHIFYYMYSYIYSCCNFVCLLILYSLDKIFFLNNKHSEYMTFISVSTIISSSKSLLVNNAHIFWNFNCNLKFNFLIK